MKKTFDEVFIDNTKLGTKVPTSEYGDAGKYIIVDQGQSQIAGYTDKEQGVFKDVPAIIFGDHTRVIKYVDRPFFLGADGTKILKSKLKDTNYKYLFYALKNVRIPNTGYNRHFKWLKMVSINYPSLLIQSNIAVVLDKLAYIIECKQRELELYDELVKARFIEVFGDPVLNSMKWEEHKLSEYILFMTSGSRGWSKYFTDDGSEVFITIKNVKNNKITLKEIQFVNAPDDKEAKRTKVQAGDLLISITADLGRTGVVSNEIAKQGAYINQHLSLIRLDVSKINPHFVSYYLETEAGKRQFASKNQSAVKAGLSFESIKSLKMFVPPMELQRDYVLFTEQADKSKAVIEKSLKELETLQASLMQKYFS